jgi:uncharacterized membrane protein YfcA
VFDFAPLLTSQLIYAAAAVFAAGMVRGFSGFGAGMVMVPVLAALYGPTVAVPVGLMLDLILAMPLLPNALRHVERGRIGLLTVAAAIGIPLGVWVLLHLQAQALRIGMSAVVFSAVLLLATGWRHKGKAHAGGTFVTGLLSGALNGAVGMGGPPVVFYFLSGPDAVAKVRASMIVFFTLLDIGSLAMLGLGGRIGGPELAKCLLLVAPLLLGVWLGSSMFHRGGDRFYRPIALVILTGIAAGSLLA